MTAKKNLMISALPALFALAFNIGCGREVESNSATKVTNGVVIKESNFPSAVLLVSLTQSGQGICTGTFVNDSQVVTAGHCVEDLDAANPYLFFSTERRGQPALVAKATSFERNPDYSIEQGVSPLDVAVINFPAGTAPAVSPISIEAPKVGANFTIVGYGNNKNYFNTQGVFDGSGSGVKREGKNRIASVSGGMISFVGLTGATDKVKAEAGQLVASGSGDSGGPMFVDGELVGVTSGGGLSKGSNGDNVSISFYVDLNSPLSRAFLAKALKPTAVSQAAEVGLAAGSPLGN